MSPSPTSRPLNPPPWLTDRRVTPATVVPVAVTRGLTADRLAGIERSWGPARDALARVAMSTGHALENAHWDWRNKVRHYPPGWHCLVAVECEGETQGLMAVETMLRPSRLDPGRWVVYVDFLEAAPWNRREPPDRRLPAVQELRFGGVGTLLIGEAVRMSVGQAANGRIGLHALPDAEEFYAGRCGMTRLGPDPGYHHLVYFEYPEGVAVRWLTDVGLSA